MNQQFTNKNQRDDEAIAHKLNQVAEQTRVNSQFAADLEERLRGAYQPKSGWFSTSLAQISPVLRWVVLTIILILVLSLSIKTLIPAPQPGSNSTPKFVCPVTLANGTIPEGKFFPEYSDNIPLGFPHFFGNDQLWSIVEPEGKIYMLPTDKLPDGSFEEKWAFFRVNHGTLTVEGHRLDAEAPPLRPDYPGGYPDSYGDTGLQILGLIFPTTGCWEVTGHVGDVSLTFVTEVVYGEAAPTPNALLVPSATPVTQNNGYDWRGTKLNLAAQLPDSPAQANVFQFNPDHHATAEEAHTLADRFGIQGDMYTAPGRIPDTTDYVISDGKQVLSVSSSRYFSYSADIVKNNRNFKGWENANADTIIGDFLKARGFDFPVSVSISDTFVGYTVQRLAPDGLPIQYEAFTFPAMLVKLDEQGNVLGIEASLIDFDPAPLGSYDIINAQEALQKLLDEGTPAGKIESSMSANSSLPKEWYRDHPDNQPVTIYGNVSANQNMDTSKPALVLIDGVPAIGNTNGMEQLDNFNFIQATGQYVVENGIRRFKVDAWKTDIEQIYVSGTLRREGDQVIITSDDGSGKQYPLIDPPSDLPMNTKTDSQLSVTGVNMNDKIEWTYIQYFEIMNYGGGGGSGGLGFDKLNLSGTPVPFPTPTQVPSPSSGGDYVVKAGDTLISIAQAHGITVDELMQANHITSPGIIQIDQQLIIPGAQSVQSDVGQRIEGQRGFMNITIYKNPDGSQRVQYMLSYTPKDAPYPSMMILEGDNLQELQAYQNRPVEIWGTVVRYDSQYAMPVVKVDRFKIPFPDLKFQILRGTQKLIDINGQPALLFTTETGTSYIQVMPGVDIGTAIMGKAGDTVILEALSIPDETFDGYPTIHIYSSGLAISPKKGKPIEMNITADQIPTYDDPILATDAAPAPPTLTIEKVELVYFISNPNYQVNDPAAKFRSTYSSTYIQPAWHFHGHYSDGSVYDILIQALKQEYLSPEIAPGITPG